MSALMGIFLMKLNAHPVIQYVLGVKLMDVLSVLSMQLWIMGYVIVIEIEFFLMEVVCAVKDLWERKRVLNAKNI